MDTALASALRPSQPPGEGCHKVFINPRSCAFSLGPMLRVMCAHMARASWAFSNWTSPSAPRTKTAQGLFPFNVQAHWLPAQEGRERAPDWPVWQPAYSAGPAMFNKAHVPKAQPALAPLCLLSGSSLQRPCEEGATHSGLF